MKAAQTPARLGRPSVTSLLGELYPTREDSGAFYREVTRVAVRHAAKKVRNRADAEDIGQQTAFSAWQHIDRFDPVRGSISRWLTPCSTDTWPAYTESERSSWTTWTSARSTSSTPGTETWTTVMTPMSGCSNVSR